MYKYFFYLLLGTSVRNMTQGFWKFFSQSLRVHSLYHTHSLAKFNGKCSSWLKNVYSARVHLEKLSRGYKSWVEGVGGITSLVSTLHIVFDNSKGGANTPFAPPPPSCQNWSPYKDRGFNATKRSSQCWLFTTSQDSHCVHNTLCLHLPTLPIPPFLLVQNLSLSLCANW